MQKEEQNVNGPALDQRARELDQREAALQQKESELEQQEQIVQKRMRDKLYDRIPVSVGTMDKVIVLLVVALVVMIVLGITRGGL